MDLFVLFILLVVQGTNERFQILDWKNEVTGGQVVGIGASVS